MTQSELNEQTTSQLPALHLLQNLGWSYLKPSAALSLRGGRLRATVLDGVLLPWLRDSNHIRYKGRTVPFSESSLHTAVQALNVLSSEGLIRANEALYHTLTLGKSLQQSINGDLRSFTLQYIDWEHPENNVYHVTEEYSVEREGSSKTRRPDLVLFVNGIPLAVIECKAPDIDDPIKQAVSQMIRNQKEGQIPHLFNTSQVLLGVCGNDARYATTGTPEPYWTAWREKEGAEEFERLLEKWVNQPLAEEMLAELVEASREINMAGRIPHVRALNERRMPGEQDRAIAALCRSERLLDLTRRFILFDGPNKKIARYQQYFAVKKIMARVKTYDREGRRHGGVVWHTQGSGKSLTMVMLARSLALDPEIENHKVVLVTDRVELDEQLKRNFQNTGHEVYQAGSGRELGKLLESPRARILSTVINKFEAAVTRGEVQLDSPDLFVLVDEGHRTQYGSFHARMRQALPKACYIGFTGTPVMKDDRDTVEKFGGLIDTYTITRAVEDGAVVPLLYEGRHVHQRVDQQAMDTWFERETHGLRDEQAAYLKQRFAATDPLNKAAKKVREVAWDISKHYSENWQGTGFKAQLVTQDKEHALMFRDYLKDIGMVSAEVLISGPDEREGETDIHTENKQAVQRFWQEMMSRYGSEREYNKQLINAFKNSEEPEIIIVVDKLLTGFDAPRSAILYLTRTLKNHTLLQAIARVNRVHEGKDFGYIVDYRGILGELSSALDLYDELEGFDAQDLEGTLTDLSAEIARLPQAHTILLDTFKEISNRNDLEEYEQLLADPELRDMFYDRLTAYSKLLSIALSSFDFLENTPQKDLDRYKRDLKFFTKLRTSVKRRYAETVDFSEYEPRIQKLLDQHVGTEETEQITTLVNIFDQQAFREEVEKLEEPSAKADTIAHRTKRTIYERMDEDPVFYQKFSKLLQDVIDEYRQERISANEYLNQVMDIMEQVVDRTEDALPSALEGREVAKAYYGIASESLDGVVEDEGLMAQVALAVDDIIERNRIVQWVDNVDVQNTMKREIEDWLFDFAAEQEFELDFDAVDEILERCLKVARRRRSYDR